MSSLDFYLQELANPLTEFLGELPRGEALLQIMRKGKRPLPDDAVRSLPVEKRLQLNALLHEFHVPLGRDIEVHEMIVDLLTMSLSQKKPSPEATANRQENAKKFAERVMRPRNHVPEAIGRCLFGPPGLGKTRTLNAALGMIPQITRIDTEKHPLLLPRTVNYVRAETPSNRKITALVSNIILALGAAVGDDYSKFAKRGNISQRLQTLAMLVFELNLGLLVIDEIQNVLRKGLQPDLELTNFVTELSNSLGVPVLLVGTPQAKFAIGGALRFARRAIGPEWGPLARGSTPWREFSTELFGHRFVGNPVVYEELEPKLYDLCQGLPGIAVNVWQFAQKQALLIELQTGKPTAVTPEIMQKAFDRYLWSVEPMISALRSGDPARISLFIDLKVDRAAVEQILLAQQAAETNKRRKAIMRLRMDGNKPRK